MTSHTVHGLDVEDYSEKAFVVRGDSKTHKDSLTALGGKWNDRLRDGAGWIFPMTKKPDVLKWGKGSINTVPVSFSYKQPYSNAAPVASENNSVDMRLVLSKLNVMEKTMKAILSKLNALSAVDDSESEYEEEEEDGFVQPVASARLLRK
jgi:hypothetical protein